MSLPQINHTQISNQFIDYWMSRVSPSATVVFLAIARKTIGWHKETDKISQGQLKELTGLSVNSIKSAIQELSKHEIITVIRSGRGKGTATEFEINYGKIVNVSKTNVSNFDPLNEPNISNSDTIERPNVSNFDTTKESNLNKEDKESTRIESAAFNHLKNRFIEHQPDSTWGSYPKEQKSLKTLCGKVELLLPSTPYTDSKLLTDALFESFIELKARSRGEYWRSCPIIPSMFLCRFPEICSHLAQNYDIMQSIEEVRKLDEQYPDVAEMFSR